jgi:hypothetical protein
VAKKQRERKREWIFRVRKRNFSPRFSSRHTCCRFLTFFLLGGPLEKRRKKEQRVARGEVQIANLKMVPRIGRRDKNQGVHLLTVFYRNGKNTKKGGGRGEDRWGGGRKNEKKVEGGGDSVRGKKGAVRGREKKSFPGRWSLGFRGWKPYPPSPQNWRSFMLCTLKGAGDFALVLEEDEGGEETAGLLGFFFWMATGGFCAFAAEGRPRVLRAS